MTAWRHGMRRALGGAALGLLLGLAAAAPAAAQPAPAAPQGGLLAAIRARGALACGTSVDFAGFAMADGSGVLRGFNVDYCRAIAAAIFGDPARVRHVTTPWRERFTALQAGQMDVMLRNTTWTFTRDVELGFEFTAINFYDGQGFIVRPEVAARTVGELGGTRICVQSDSSSAANLADWARAAGLSFATVTRPLLSELEPLFARGECDVLSTDISALAAVRATLPRPNDHVILAEVISKEPLGPLVRRGDQGFADLVRWVHFGLLAAEELGITQETVEQAAASDYRPEAQRMLGRTGELGRMLGVGNDWLVRVVRAVGNYGEIYARNLAPIGLQRGPNELWNSGGLQYAPPFR